jgi:hypothetical protein
MVKRVASIVAAVDIREPIHDHNPAYWRYIQQRALQLRLLIQLLRELNIFETSSPAPFDAGLITQFESQLVAHDEYVERKRGAAASFARETHPFSSFLIDALRFTRGRKAASEAGEDEVVAMLERCRALIAISKYHQELGWSSFARSVSQAFLSTHGSNTFRELFGNWEELVRETSLRHAFESADAHEQRRRALFEQWSTEALEEEPQI